MQDTADLVAVIHPPHALQGKLLATIGEITLQGPVSAKNYNIS
jgi:hypothetical protein